ncbi:MAG: hypothetical protein K6B46_03350 [Opitutales bacterium]|nr:hypothetical protein [Opitutales bacterium]
MNFKKLLIAASAFAFCVPAGLLAEQVVVIGDTFKCFFQDEGENGFNTLAGGSVATWTQTQIDAVVRSLTTWDNLILNTPGRTLTVGVFWESGSGALAYAGSPMSYRLEAGFQQVSTLAEKIWRDGVSNTGSETGSYDVQIFCNYDYVDKFYYGVTPFSGWSELYDFQSVLTHELGHGIGFSSNLQSDCTFMADGETVLYTAFDSLLRKEGDAQTLVEKAEASDNAPVVALGEKILLDGTDLWVYNPASYIEGSSFSHIDAESDPDALMQYALVNGVSHRSPTEAEIGLMSLMGWSMIPEPSLFGLWAGTLALALAGTRRRRR